MYIWHEYRRKRKCAEMRKNMQTAVIGYPRIGTLRELKFASEQYFRKEIEAGELLQTAKELRKTHWLTQKEAGISFISSNDFSFYDNMLDTAVLFGIVPKRYKELQLSELDIYFAMARGYQGDSGDVKALAMKKWFNTNYHYIVPEVEDEMVIELKGNKLFAEYHEAKELEITTKPTVIGAYTLLKLSRYTGTKKMADYVDAVSKAYRDLIVKCETEGIDWLQFDEPALVQDMGQDEIHLFHKLYDEILATDNKCHVLLQTYFGDVRDIYEDLIQMPFSGIGLDFIEGRKTIELVEKYGFPNDKVLFAGLVNGKNIWKNNYKKTLETVSGLKNAGINVVIGTSCSLLHVPYTLENESRLSEDYTKHLSFAVEKLTELSQLKNLADNKNPESEKAYNDNIELFSIKRVNSFNDKVKKRVADIKESDFVRLPAFNEREKIQKAEFGLPMFPTTTIGSFPQTADVKANRSAYNKNDIPKEEYVDFNKKKIAEWVKIQEDLDIDVLVHGEFERNDMVEYFGEQLDGYVFTEKAWVQSYGTRCVKPPVIWGDVSRNHPMTVDWSVYAQSLTDRPMKGMLTGPVTILNWSFPREDVSIKESTYQIALAIRDEVLDLEKAGISVIQVDEAALREKLPLRKTDWYSQYLDWAIPSFRLVHSGVKAETQIHTHMCYSEFTDIITAIDDMDADVITFEASRSDLQILDSLKENNFKTEVGPGVYDIHSPRVPSTDEIKSALKKMLEKIDADKLWVNPDCGLKTRGEKETLASLYNLVKAAKELREEYK